MRRFFTIILLILTLGLIAEEPIMRVGIMTDTHVSPKPNSCELLKEALLLFKAQKAEMIVNLGDIADKYWVEAYKNYRDTVNAVYPDAKLKPREVFIYANHDRIHRQKESIWNVFKDVKKHLEATNDPYDLIKYKGYNFVVIPQSYNGTKYRDLLDKAMKDTPDKPVFVFDHIPPSHTVYNSSTWGRQSTRDILERYPRAIHISGHVHGTLTNELNIWQGNFTAVNAGCLQLWAGAFIGNSPSVKKSDMVIVMEVFKDRIVFRRFFAKSKVEYMPEEPWIVKMPFDKNTAAYNNKLRRAQSPAPEFSSDASITVKECANGVEISYPHAKHKYGVSQYKVEILENAGGKWNVFARKDAVGNHYFMPSERPAKGSFMLSYGYFDSGKEYRVRITPVHFFNNEGKPLSAAFTIKNKPESKVIFESNDPMKDFACLNGLAGGKRFVADSEGFYNINKVRENVRLEFPDKVWTGKRGTRFRFTVDMHFKQTLESPWTVVLRNPEPLRNANMRIMSVPGDAGIMRYVIEFSKARDNFIYYLLIREGGKGKMKFERVKLEIIK